MIVKKVIVGFVVQNFDTEKKDFVSQDFIASEEVTYEDEYGEAIDEFDFDGLTEAELHFEMKQPE